MKLDSQWENERKKLKEQSDELGKLQATAESYKNDARAKLEKFNKEREEYQKQVGMQNTQKLLYSRENINEKKEFFKNEDALIEYKNLTFKQSKKIKELKDEIEQLNVKFPEEVTKYTKEIEFLKFDNQNKRSELDFKIQSKHPSYFSDQSDVLRVLHKESKQLRKHLQLILDQRSELEHFFIEEIQTISLAVTFD